eukprot:m.198106 g.198106  ORF g.198106 m.198106 type:complete len:834 (-) comp20360_c0_seq1:134-2635(-)
MRQPPGRHPRYGGGALSRNPYGPIQPPPPPVSFTLEGHDIAAGGVSPTAHKGYNRTVQNSTGKEGSDAAIPSWLRRPGANRMKPMVGSEAARRAQGLPPLGGGHLGPMDAVGRGSPHKGGPLHLNGDVIGHPTWSVLNHQDETAEIRGLWGTGTGGGRGMGVGGVSGSMGGAHGGSQGNASGGLDGLCVAGTATQAHGGVGGVHLKPAGPHVHIDPMQHGGGVGSSGFHKPVVAAPHPRKRISVMEKRPTAPAVKRHSPRHHTPAATSRTPSLPHPSVSPQPGGENDDTVAVIAAPPSRTPPPPSSPLPVRVSRDADKRKLRPLPATDSDGNSDTPAHHMCNILPVLVRMLHHARAWEARHRHDGGQGGAESTVPAIMLSTPRGRRREKNWNETKARFFARKPAMTTMQPPPAEQTTTLLIPGDDSGRKRRTTAICELDNDHMDLLRDAAEAYQNAHKDSGESDGDTDVDDAADTTTETDEVTLPTMKKNNFKMKRVVKPRPADVTIVPRIHLSEHNVDSGHDADTPPPTATHGDGDGDNTAIDNTTPQDNADQAADQGDTTSAVDIPAAVDNTTVDAPAPVKAKKKRGTAWELAHIPLPKMKGGRRQKWGFARPIHKAKVQNLDDVLDDLNPHSAKAFDFLSRMCILPEWKKEAYRIVFDTMDREKTESITAIHMCMGLKAICGRNLSDREIDFVAEMLDLNDPKRGGRGINFDEFAMAAALAEHVDGLEPHVRGQIDPEELIDKKQKAMLMFFVDAEQDCTMHLDDLEMLLDAGRVAPDQKRQIVERLAAHGDSVTFLEYLAYVPLFLDLHSDICTNTFEDELRSFEADDC